MLRRFLLVGSLLASVSMCAPAYAQAVDSVDWLDPKSYSAEAMAGRSAYEEPNLRYKNYMGALYERKALRRGLTGAAAVGFAMAATYALGGLNEFNAQRALSPGSLIGAGKAFMVGCAAGGVAGAVGAAFSAGTTVLGGCLAVGLSGALYEVYEAGTEVPLDEQGNIKVRVPANINDPVELTGPGVLPGTIGSVQNDGQTHLFSCSPSSAPFAFSNCRVPSNTSFTQLYSQYGLNRTFSCMMFADAQSTWEPNTIRACVFLPTVVGSSGGWRLPHESSGIFDSPRGPAIVYPNGAQLPTRVGSAADARCAGNKCFLGATNGPIQSNNPGASTVTLFISTANYGSSAVVPHQQIETYVKRPFWAEVLGGRISENSAQLKLSNEILAALANTHLASAGLADPADPITAQEVADLKVARPDLTPRIGDLVRPHDHPGKEEQAASETKAAVAAQPVTITNLNQLGGAAKPTDYDVKVTADDPALPEFGVAIDSFSYDAGQCPRFNLGVSFSDPEVQRRANRMGVIEDRPVDWMCGPLEDNADWLRPLLLLLISIHAFVIFRN